MNKKLIGVTMSIAMLLTNQAVFGATSTCSKVGNNTTCAAANQSECTKFWEGIEQYCNENKCSKCDVQSFIGTCLVEKECNNKCFSKDDVAKMETCCKNKGCNEEVIKSYLDSCKQKACNENEKTSNCKVEKTEEKAETKVTETCEKAETKVEKTETKNEVKEEVKPVEKTEEKAEAKEEAKAEAKAEVKEEVKTETCEKTQTSVATETTVENADESLPVTGGLGRNLLIVLAVSTVSTLTYFLRKNKKEVKQLTK